MIIEKYNKEN